MERLIASTYVLLTTFRRDGTPVATPVWIVALAHDTAGCWTSSTSGKVKRLAHTSRVTLQPCDSRGTVQPGSVPVDATARVVEGVELDAIRAAVRKEYGILAAALLAVARIGATVRRRPSSYADRGVVISLV